MKNEKDFVSMEAYLDNAATTRVLPEVAQLMTKIMCEEYGNPSSMHKMGMDGEMHIRKAKEIFAAILKVNEKELYFTSSGTEADNLGIIGTSLANNRRGKHIITTKIEHPAVGQTMKYLESQGYEVTCMDVDAYGCINLEELKLLVREDTILVSIMHTNNEIGSLQPIKEAGELIKRCNPNTLFHVDAVQGFGKARIHPKKMKVDLLSISSHKIHGPKGVGLLYVGEKVKILPISYGGGQQKNLRPGTENVPGIAGFAMAAQIAHENLEEDRERLYSLKEYFLQGVRKIDQIVINGISHETWQVRDSAPHVLSLSIEGIRSEVLLHALEEKGIFVSSGSACASNKPEISKTLQAIKLAPEYLDATIRFSFSSYTTKEELDYTLEVMYDMIPMLRRFKRR